MEKKKDFTEQARLLKNKALREWRKANPDKVKEHDKNYWERKALQDKE